MARRKLYDEHGNEVKQGGGWLKRLGIVVLLVVAGVYGYMVNVNQESSNITEAQVVSGSTSGQVKEETIEESLPGIGETVEFEDFEITINNVSYTDARNQFDDTDPDEVLKIEYTFTNNSEKDVSYSSSDFKVYVDGRKMGSYPNENDLGSLSPGRTIEGVAHHGLKGEGEIEIEWSPMSYFGGEKAIFAIDASDIK